MKMRINKLKKTFIFIPCIIILSANTIVAVGNDASLRDISIMQSKDINVQIHNKQTVEILHA